MNSDKVASKKMSSVRNPCSCPFSFTGDGTPARDFSWFALRSSFWLWDREPQNTESDTVGLQAFGMAFLGYSMRDLGGQRRRVHEGQGQGALVVET